MEAFDRGYYSGRACSKCLDNAAFLDSVYELLNGKLALRDPKLAQALADLEDRIACNARKDFAAERRCDQLSLAFLVFPEKEKVHDADLRHNVVYEPQYLAVLRNEYPVFVNLLHQILNRFLRVKRRSIVATKLLVSVSFRPGADRLICTVKPDRLKSRWKIGSNW